MSGHLCSTPFLRFAFAGRLQNPKLRYCESGNTVLFHWYCQYVPPTTTVTVTGCNNKSLYPSGCDALLEPAQSTVLAVPSRGKRFKCLPYSAFRFCVPSRMTVACNKRRSLRPLSLNTWGVTQTGVVLNCSNKTFNLGYSKYVHKINFENSKSMPKYHEESSVLIN
jgi:hypothetical protein